MGLTVPAAGIKEAPSGHVALQQDRFFKEPEPDAKRQ
jgi:hypothetical protein